MSDVPSEGTQNQGSAQPADYKPGRLGKSRAKSLDRDGDRVVYTGNRNAKPFERISDFLELLDE